MICICTSVLLTYQTLSLFNSSILLLAFAAFDFAKTKWIKINVIDKEHLKKFGKFIWRHLLTLTLSYFVFEAISHGTIKVNISGAFEFYFFSVLIDWIKVKIKFNGNGSYDSHEKMMNYSRRENDWSHTGSSAWMSNPGMVGSPANHLYNLGYNSGSTHY